MTTRPTSMFPLVDEFHGIRMGVDLALLEPRRVTVVESSRRLQKEQSYGYIRALWWLWLEDERSAVSVLPGTGDAVGKIASGVRSAERLLEPQLAQRLKGPVNALLREAGMPEADRVLHDVVFACNAELLRRHECGDCRRFVADSLASAPGAELPTHCFPDGIVYGVVVDGEVVSVAYAHRTGLMEDRVADLGVGTARGHLRRGYAKTAVSAVVEHITARGGEARYGCAPDNAGSIATALSVGFVPYGVSLTLSAPRRDQVP